MSGPVQKGIQTQQYLLSKPRLNQEIELKAPSCYHCEKKPARLKECEIWGVSACEDCIAELHQTNHKSCKKEKHESNAPSSLSTIGDHEKNFSLKLTHFTGAPVTFMCKSGEKIGMDDHWAGTYLFFPGRMVLVLESRDEINAAILEGLRTAA